MNNSKMIYLGNSKEIPVKVAKRFFYPIGDLEGKKRPALLIHLEEGFVAYDGLCTHMQAELEWDSFTEKIWCTLHDGMYNPKTGSPFRGMPKEALKSINLKISKNGDIYAII
jgi:nitrite reductase/ring-hydroxylating ferredoxin subunit